MRTHKYRAWDKISEKIRYVSQLTYGEKQEGEPEWDEGDLTIVWMLGGSPSGKPYDLLIDYVHLMQFTGLTDKNGVYIFEDDIIKDWEGIDLYRVVWNKTWACFELDRITHVSSTGQGIDDIKSCEVVGNVYSNPELLKPPVEQ